MKSSGVSPRSWNMWNRSARKGRLCDAELIPRLRGLEGRQAVLAFGDSRRVRCLIGQQRFGARSCMSPSKTKRTTANRSPWGRSAG